jgi:LCP family protein required for cell wall assembly
VNVVVATSLVGASAVYAYVKWRLDSIPTRAAPHLTSVKQNPGGLQKESGGLAPENILLIGNQTRAGQVGFGDPKLLSGSLSDVIMLVHLDPVNHTASLLSIPRDLFVPMPAGSPVGPYQKIDAALNDGANGPDNLIAAITADLGIPINHYVELEFNGSEAMVNALGGIRVDFPAELYDSSSGLFIGRTGCQLLSGAQALALIRARHLQYDAPGSPGDARYWPADPESDLSRIARDQVIVRVLVSTAESEGLTNPIKLNNFIGALVGDLLMDPGLKNQVTDLALQYRHFDPFTASELTLPVTVVSGYHYAGSIIGDVDFADQPADNAAIRAWDPEAFPAPVMPTAVSVRNLAGTRNLATRTAADLAADGLPAVATGDLSVPASQTETLIKYAPGQIAQAIDVEDHLLGAVVLQPDPTQPPGTVTVEAGSTLAVAPSPGAAASGAATSVPTPGGQNPSPAAAPLPWWEPRPCS